MDLFEDKNLGLYVVECTGSMSKLLKYNGTSHLDDLAH